MESNEHQKLTNIIKGVHRKLRKAVASSSDYKKVWDEHLKEKDLRENYANAMHKLATQIWKGKESRIEWSYKTCLDYFYNGGLERSLMRQMKLKRIGFQKESMVLSNIPEVNEDIHEENSFKDLGRKLKLLDVGSCYNPFLKFEVLQCTAIDLTPATKDVLQIDFLHLEVKPKTEENLLFHEEEFDIVVLSLVLEYLPAPQQRLVFCYKSWQLLKNNGLCIIITPDSNNVHHNAHMMKSWKIGLEKIGFIRVKYDKLQHIHCMAFRKIKPDSIETIDWNSVSKHFYIPQDFLLYTEEENQIERTEEESSQISNNFLELPFEDIF